MSDNDDRGGLTDEDLRALSLSPKGLADMGEEEFLNLISTQPRIVKRELIFDRAIEKYKTRLRNKGWGEA